MADLYSLLDRRRDFLGFAGAVTHNFGGGVADYDKRRKAHVLSALDHLGHAVDADHLFLQVQVLRINAFGCSVHRHSLLKLQSCFTRRISQAPSHGRDTDSRPGQRQPR